MRLLCLLLLAPSLLPAICGCHSASLTAAKLYLREDEALRAREQLELALRESPDNAEVHFLLGSIAADQRRYAAMDSAFQQSWRLSDEYHARIEAVRHRFWASEMNLGAARLEAVPPSYRGAAQAYAHAITIDSRPLKPWHSIGYAYTMLDSLEAAAGIYAHVLASVPGDTDALAALGAIRLRQGANVQASEVYERLTGANPHSSSAYTNWGIALERSDRLDEAEQRYREAIRLAPASALAHYNLGNLLWQQQRLVEACEEYEQAWELNPTDVDARYNLAITYVDLGRLQEALRVLMSLIEDAPDSGDLWSEIGRIQAMEGDSAASRAAYARADSIRVDSR